MLKRTTVEMTVPSAQALGALEWVRQGFLNGAIEWEEWAYKRLVVDAALTSGGNPVRLNAAFGDNVMYAGPAGHYLVFCIPIWDGEEEKNDLGWLRQILPLSHDELPAEGGQGVYIVASNLPGQRCSAVLAVWCGSAESVLTSGVVPMRDDRIVALVNAL